MKLLKVFMSTVAVATLTTSCSSLSSFGNGDYYNNYNSYGQQNYQGAAYGSRPVHTANTEIAQKTATENTK